MQPYGNLQYPDGTSQYSPPINTAANGANKIETLLNQSGQFSLTVFDSSNQGGTVSVKVGIAVETNVAAGGSGISLYAIAT